VCYVGHVCLPFYVPFRINLVGYALSEVFVSLSHIPKFCESILRLFNFNNKLKFTASYFILLDYTEYAFFVTSRVVQSV
jgi:hypothetical protein